MKKTKERKIAAVEVLGLIPKQWILEGLIDAVDKCVKEREDEAQAWQDDINTSRDTIHKSEYRLLMKEAKRVGKHYADTLKHLKKAMKSFEKAEVVEG